MRSAAQRLARAAAAKRAVSSLRIGQRNALQRDAFAHARAFKNGKLAPTIQHLSSVCMSTSASDDKGASNQQCECDCEIHVSRMFMHCLYE